MMKVSIVNYVNSYPFLNGLKHFNLPLQIEEDIPSICAQKLIQNQVDIGLIPSAALIDLPNYQIISSFGIASINRVNSVFVYSNVPIKQVNKIVLDKESRTSNLLTKVLAAFYWNIEVQFIEDTPHWEKDLHTAKIAIGDKTFATKGKYPFQYDLATEWNNFTNLPFVFAVWASNKPIPTHYIQEFDRVFTIGLMERDQIINSIKHQYPTMDLKDYYYNCIQYSLNESALQGLNHFHELIKKLVQKN